MNKNIIGGIIGMVLLGVIFLGYSIKTDNNSKLGGIFSAVNDITFFSATTTNATSTNAQDATNITGAKKVTFSFSRGGTTGANTGTSTFSVQVSEDGSTWTTFNKLVDNVSNSISQNLTRVASVDLVAATTTKNYSMDLTYDLFKYVRCIVFEVIDGDHTCKATIGY